MQTAYLIYYISTVDLMYPIGNGSRTGDLELKYSLRSVEKFLSGYHKVFIVGRLPKWVNKDKVVYIPFVDGTRKQHNIFSKIITAIDNGISNRFMFWNDDHYLLKPLKSFQLKYYYEKTTDYHFEKREGKYKTAIGNTSHGNFYDVHTPIIYNGTVFKNTVGKLDWSKEYVIKSAYCNRLSFLDKEEIEDLKIDFQYPYEKLKDKIKDRMFFSTGDYGLGSGMKQLLNELYSHKSKYEL